MSDWIDLADAVRMLRRELEAAGTAAVGETLRFELGPVEVEFAVTVTREGGLNGGVKLGVATIGANGSLGKDSSHRLKLVLIPKDVTTGRAPEIAAEIDGIPER